MKAEDVDFFEKVQAQLGQLHKEMSALAKSKADNPVNKFKLKLMNQKLAEANTILVGGFAPFEDFETFPEEDLPSNSDVVMVLSQYLECLEGWRSANVVYNPSDYEWYWKTDDRSSIKSRQPSRFRVNAK